MRPRLKWWRELLTIGIFYELYSLARNTQGSGSTSPTHAFRNARVIINFEKAIGLYNEEAVQRLFLGSRHVVKAMNVYYGAAHFLVTAGVLMWLFLRHPERYTRWRWALASTTLLGLVGFVAFPLMPPRLLTSALGVGSYVDTLQTIGGLWNFEDGAIAKLSNQYAAMPSLHFAWSLWVLLALWPCLRHSWARVLAVLHPTITLVAIVATANHYWLDAAGGAVALFLGWLLGGVLGTRAVSRVGGWPRMPAGRAAATTPTGQQDPDATELGEHPQPAAAGAGHTADLRTGPRPVKEPAGAEISSDKERRRSAAPVDAENLEGRAAAPAEPEDPVAQEAPRSAGTTEDEPPDRRAAPRHPLADAAEAVTEADRPSSRA